MKNELTIIEIRLIQHYLSSRTDEQIAELIGKPVEVVVAKISELTGVFSGALEKRKEHQEKIDARLKRTEKQYKIKRRQELRKEAEELERKREKKRKRIADEREREQQRAMIKKKERVFKTKKVDLADSVAVRINNKTIIYVKPGTDIEAIKKKYGR